MKIYKLEYTLLQHNFEPKFLTNLSAVRTDILLESYQLIFIVINFPFLFYHLKIITMQPYPSVSNSSWNQGKDLQIAYEVSYRLHNHSPLDKLETLYIKILAR